MNMTQRKPTTSLCDTDVLDSQMWQKLKEGDEVAFAAIYKQNVHRLYSYGLKLVTDKNLIQDGIQDLFIEI